MIIMKAGDQVYQKSHAHRNKKKRPSLSLVARPDGAGDSPNPSHDGVDCDCDEAVPRRKTPDSLLRWWVLVPPRN